MDEEIKINTGKSIGYTTFLTNKRSLFAYISCSLICVYTSFNSSFLSIVLEDYGLDGTNIGYIFAVPCLMYALSSALVTYIIRRFPRRLFVFFSFLLASLSLLFMGPSSLLNLPNYLWVIVIGLVMNGIAQGFIFIPVLPEIIESVYVKENVVPGENYHIDMLINDKAAGLYGTFYATGQIIAPILGGVLYDTTNNRITCDILAVTCLCYSFIYFFGNVGFKVFKEEKIFRAHL